MKKFGKFLFGTLSLAAAAGGIYCLYKKQLNKDADFDDFDEDDADEDDDRNVSADPEDREYVSITITTENATQEDAAENAETSVDVEPDASNESVTDGELADADESAVVPETAAGESAEDAQPSAQDAGKTAYADTETPAAEA